MKKTFILVLLALFCICGYAQIIDPVLLEEMGQRRDNEKIRVFVIMRQQYDQQQLNRRATQFMTRAERREFVVNELKQFAETSQYDLRHSLTEMQRNEMVSEPKMLWIANAIFLRRPETPFFPLLTVMILWSSASMKNATGFPMERRHDPPTQPARLLQMSRK